MAKAANGAETCGKCAYWDRGECRHGLADDHDRRSRGGCSYFSRDVSPFAFFVKEWRW